MKFQSGDRVRDGLFRTLLVVAAKTIGTTQLLTLYPLESKHDKTIFQDKPYSKMWLTTTS